MLKQNEVIEILEEFKSYSISQNPENEAAYSAFFEPLYNELDKYFDHAEFKKPLNELVFNIYCDLTERLTEYEFQVGEPLPTNYPVGYEDFRALFYSFDFNFPESEFHAAWYSSTPEGSTISVLAGNSYIDEWVSDLKTAKTEELAKINAVISWCQDSCSLNDMANLFEESGSMIRSPTNEDLAQNIYIQKELLKVIETLNIPIYIPSYIKES